MTNEERDIIARFIERISGAQGASGFVPGGNSALPPIDREADQLIGDLLARYPEARYRLTQTAYAQEQALAQAGARIQQLQAALQQAQSVQAQQPEPPQRSGGFFSGLFGGGQPRPATPGVWNQQQPGYQPQYQQPQYAPPPPYPMGQPGMMGGSGSGFLGSALRTAAGVAGGVVVGNALMNLFEGSHQAEAAVLPVLPVENSPWSAPAQPDNSYVDQGSWTQDTTPPAPPDPVSDNSWADSGNDNSSSSDSDSWI